MNSNRITVKSTNNISKFLRRITIMLACFGPLMLCGCYYSKDGLRDTIDKFGSVSVSVEPDQPAEDSVPSYADSKDERILQFLDAWKTGFHERDAEELEKLIAADGYSSIEVRDNHDFFGKEVYLDGLLHGRGRMTV